MYFYSMFETIGKFLKAFSAIEEFNKGQSMWNKNQNQYNQYNQQGSRVVTYTAKPARPDIKIGNRQKVKVNELCTYIMDSNLPREYRFKSFLAFRSWVRGFFGTNKHSWDLSKLYDTLIKDGEVDEKDMERFMKDIAKDFVIEEPKAEVIEGEVVEEPKALAAAPTVEGKDDEEVPFGVTDFREQGEMCGND